MKRGKNNEDDDNLGITEVKCRRKSYKKTRIGQIVSGRKRVQKVNKEAS
jgi:hypothetical protein